MRTQRTQALLDHLDNTFFPRWDGLEHAGAVRTDRILEILDPLKRARREFDSKLFFIVVFGPLKSGKSTLVNSLAREYVSPTLFAQECTRRSSVVIKSETRGIDLYFTAAPSSGDFESKSQNRDADRLAFETVIHYLRGLISEEQLLRRVHRQSVEYNPSNIQRFLSADLEEEPLIVVIRSPGGKLISEDIAVLDVPGLDGHYSNYEKNPSRFWVIHKSDFLIFTQSSFSPLNHLTGAFLKELYLESKKPPVWLVQNKMEARYWVDQAVRDQEAREQLQVAIQEITSLLGVEKSELHHSSINLGKAHDGIFTPDQNLLAESRFEAFETKLRRELDQTRINVLEQNSLNELRLQTLQAERKLNELHQEIDADLERRRLKLEQLRRLIDRLQAVEYRTSETESSFAEFFHSEIKDREDQAKSLVTEQCGRARDWIRDRHPPTRSGKQMLRGRDINVHLATLAEDLASDLTSKHFDLLDSLGSEIAKRAASLAARAEERTIEEVNTELERQSLPALPPLPRWDIEQMPRLKNQPLTFPHYREKRWILGFIPWPRKYPFGAVQGQLKHDLPLLFSKEIASRAKAWFADLKRAFYENYANQRRNTLRSHVEKLIQEESARIDEGAAQAEKAIQHVNDLLHDLTDVKERIN